jgi:hypothetical protein
VSDQAFRGAFAARLDGRRLALVARDTSDNRTVLRQRLRRCR